MWTIAVPWRVILSPKPLSEKAAPKETLATVWDCSRLNAFRHYLCLGDRLYGDFIYFLSVANQRDETTTEGSSI
jgi:hypothetical protein